MHVQQFCLVHFQKDNPCLDSVPCKLKCVILVLFLFFLAGLPLWFGLCSLEEPGQEQAYLEWMLEEAYAANPGFAPRAFMLDKAGAEHKAVEAVLMRRARMGLEDFVSRLNDSLSGDFREADLAQARAYFTQKQARETHLQKLATGATRLDFMLTCMQVNAF